MEWPFCRNTMTNSAKRKIQDYQFKRIDSLCYARAMIREKQGISSACIYYHNQRLKWINLYSFGVSKDG